MHVVDMLAGQVAVQGRVDGCCPRVEIEGRMAVHANHVVFGL